MGILSLPTLGILGIGALLGLVFGIVALVKASQQPGVYGGKGLAISGIVASVLSIVVVPFIAGIIAAIAIPSLLRARVSANESATIGDLRAVISAEMAYGSASGGAYGSVECLSAPARCLPNYPATGPTFLDAETVVPTRHGYVRTFHPGPPAPTRPGTPPSSPSSLSAFAYVAVPVTWNRTGTRAFCADSTGQVCSTRGGIEPTVVDGLCSAPCEPLR